MSCLSFSSLLQFADQFHVSVLSFAVTLSRIEGIVRQFAQSSAPRPVALPVPSFATPPSSRLLFQYAGSANPPGFETRSDASQGSRLSRLFLLEGLSRPSHCRYHASFRLLVIPVSSPRALGDLVTGHYPRRPWLSTPPIDQPDVGAFSPSRPFTPIRPAVAER